MFIQLFLGFAWTCLTIVVAVAFIVALMEVIDRIERISIGVPEILRNGGILTFSVIWMLVAMIFVVAAWAFLFAVLGAFTRIEDAFYFAIVSITTVGFGDIVLDENWRILSGFAAADGFIVFGLDTAVLFEILRRLREETAIISKTPSE